MEGIDFVGIKMPLGNFNFGQGAAGNVASVELEHHGYLFLGIAPGLPKLPQILTKLVFVLVIQGVLLLHPNGCIFP